MLNENILNKIACALKLLVCIRAECRFIHVQCSVVALRDVVRRDLGKAIVTEDEVQGHLSSCK